MIDFFFRKQESVGNSGVYSTDKPKFLLFIFAFVSLSSCPVLSTPFLFPSLFQNGGAGLGGEVLPIQNYENSMGRVNLTLTLFRIAIA